MAPSSAAILMALSCLSSPQGIRVEPLTSFDGRTWSGLVLGELRDPDLKRMYGAGKGSIRPEGMTIPTFGSAGVRVDALMDARGAKATLRGIRLEYLVNAPSLAEASSELGREPVILWQPGRWEDWSLAVFPGKGIAAELIEGDDRPRVWFLFDPAKSELAMSRFDRNETEIVERPDPGADWDRVCVYGEVQAVVTVESQDRIHPDLDSRGRSRLADRAEDLLMAIRRGPLVYERGGSGDIQATIRFGRFDREGKVKVTATLSVDTPTPYQRIQLTETRSKDIYGGYLSRSLDLLDEAGEALARRVRERVNQLGPPPYSHRREAALLKFMDDITGTRPVR